MALLEGGAVRAVTAAATLVTIGARVPVLLRNSAAILPTATALSQQKGSGGERTRARRQACTLTFSFITTSSPSPAPASLHIHRSSHAIVPKMKCHGSSFIIAFLTFAMFPYSTQAFSLPAKITALESLEMQPRF